MTEVFILYFALASSLPIFFCFNSLHPRLSSAFCRKASWPHTGKRELRPPIEAVSRGLCGCPHASLLATACRLVGLSWARAVPIWPRQVPSVALQSPTLATKPTQPRRSPRCVYMAVNMSRRWNLKHARGEWFTGCSVYKYRSARSVCLIAQCTVTPVAPCIIHLPQHQSCHLLKTVISWSEFPFYDYLFLCN